MLNALICNMLSLIKLLTVLASHCTRLFQFNLVATVSIIYLFGEKSFSSGCFCGKSQTGAVFTCMSRPRIAFKLTLRCCRKHEEKLKADARAKSLGVHDAETFWNSVIKI